MSTPLHVSKFNERIKAMNASSGKELRMTAAEARALHTDIFAMLDELHNMQVSSNEPQLIELKLDAGDNSL